MKLKLVIIGLLFCSLHLRGQVPTIQDCLGAIPVCQQIYSEGLSPSGDGNYNSEINTSISCTAGELNSIWYTFTVSASGNFGFLITPNDLNDDYDWALFNITDASCDDIGTDPSIVVSCNAAGGNTCNGTTGATGDTNFSQQGGGCNSPTPSINIGQSPFNDLIPVIAGNTYVLMVSNWSGSPNGYEIDFGLGTGIGIFDEDDPFIDEIAVPEECDDQTITVTFNEFIQCNTIDGDNFVLTGPGGPFAIDVTATACAAGGAFDKVFTLTMTPPISQLGNYNLQLITDSATEVLDLCDNAANDAGFDFEVTNPLFLDVQLGADTAVFCVGQTVVLDVTNVDATYVWQDGSTDPTFTVSNPGVYAVTVTNPCGVGTDEIEITYLNDLPTVDIGDQLTLCEGDDLFLDATNDFSSYLWQDGFTGAVYSVTDGGLFSVDVSNACGTTSDDVLVTFIPAIDLDLPDAIALCLGDTLFLDVTQEGSVTYEWFDGSILPTQSIDKPGVYSISITSDCEVVTDSIEVNFISTDPIDIGPDAILCFGDSIEIGVPIVGASYIWSNGSTDPTILVEESGFYAVTITTDCRIFEDDIALDFIPPIAYDLGPDQFLCSSQIFLDAATQGFAEYLWSDGSDLPFLIAGEPGIYTVNVFNQCESVTQEVELFECEQCDIYFPNVFSPNFDGINDNFRPASDCELLDYDLAIFDRWGGLLFQTDDPFDGWDGIVRGQQLPNATYVWRAQFTVIENNIPRRVEASGDVIILK